MEKVSVETALLILCLFDFAHLVADLVLVSLL